MDWICRIFNVYFDNKALKKLKKPAINANHFNIETGERYWISGIKKNGQNRHQFGGGKIMIDKNCIEDYLKLVDFNNIDEKYFEIVEFSETDKNRFNTIENTETEYRDENYPVTCYDNNLRKFIFDL